MLYFTLSALLLVGTFCLIGMSAGRAGSARDYAVASRNAGAFSVAGVIMGALVAGGSTIGTVQLAYISGLSGWWFTLGSGIGCALLGLGFARPLRRSGLTTITEFIERSYGKPTATVTMVSSILGTLLSVVSQFIAGTALICSVFPISFELATLALSAMILFFIFLGGLKSYSRVSNAKTVILYLLLAACCVRVLTLGQNPLVLITEMDYFPWLCPFGRGFGADIGAGLSLALGILCTQIYIQAVFAAADADTARKGCLTAAFLIPPLGLMAVWIGLAMRNMGIEVAPAQALPYFIKTYFHPSIAGLLWAGLAITIVGGASGLCLGIATNLSNDVYLKLRGERARDSEALIASKATVILCVGGSALLAIACKNSLILQLSYIGMGMRGAGMFIPFVFAILRPGTFTPKSAFYISLCGISGMILSAITLPGIEPLFTGIAASLAAAAITRGR